MNFRNLYILINLRYIKMKITIDTKEDSHEEIRKAIKMLSSLIGHKETFSNQPNIFDSDITDLSPSGSEPEPTNAFAAMFGSSSSQDDEDKNNEMKVEESDDFPEIIEYH